MITKQQFTQQNGISDRTFYNWVNTGKIITRYIPSENKTYVIPLNENKIELTKNDLLKVIESFKSEFEEMILQVADGKLELNKCIESIEEKQQWLEMHGVKRICGFKLRSIYNKIDAFKIKLASSEKLELKRKPRKDIGKVRNAILSDANFREKILPELCNFYITNGNYESKDRVSSARLAVDLLIKYAQNELEKGNDEFIEMLVPSCRQAAYRWFLKQLDRLGLKQVTIMANHAGKWREQYEVKNKGAFTNDINFNDYWMMDDHEIHIAGGYEWDETLKEMKMQTLKLWTLIEAYTMKPLAYVLKTGELTSDDVVNVLIQAMSKYGLPAKGILYDNGRITTAEKVEEFVLTVIRHPGIRHLTGSAMTDFNPCRPYTPTDKSNVELFHSIFERESSVFIQNFISGKRENGRHTGLKLSPEECINMVEELKSYYISYLAENGFYQTRLRDRQLKNTGVTISISKHWENCTRDWKFEPIKGEVLRYAYSEKKLVTYSNQVKFKLNRVDQVFVPMEYLSYIYNDKQFMAAYNPNNYAEIDLYAVQRINGEDVYTGEIIKHEPGDLVVTLHNLNHMTSEQRRELVAKLNKQKRKATKEAEKFVKMKANIENPLLTALRVNENNEIIDGQKIVEKEARKIIDGKLEEVAQTVYINAKDVITEPLHVELTDDDVLNILAEDDGK